MSESLGCPFVAEANLPYPVQGIWSGGPPPHVTPTPPFLLWSPRLPLPISSHVNKLLFPMHSSIDIWTFPTPLYEFRCLTLFLVLSLVRWLLFTSFLVSSDFSFQNNGCIWKLFLNSKKIFLILKIFLINFLFIKN